MKNIIQAKQKLAALAAHSWRQGRKGPRYWLMIIGGSIMTLALLLEVAISYEWFGMLWRDERGQLSAEFVALSMFFALLTALVIGVILHHAYLRMPRWMKTMVLVVLALLAISIIIAAPLSIVMTQPGMTGNTLVIGDAAQQPFMEQLSQLAMANRAMLFLLAAAVATLGIELLRQGVRGLAAVRQAKREAAQHEKYLKKLTKVEQMSIAMASEEQRKHAYINNKFVEASRSIYLQEERHLRRYLRGERFGPTNREQLDERLEELMAEPDLGASADDELEAFARDLAKRYMPARLHLADLPPAHELPPQARAWIEKHAQWLQWMATQTHQRLKEEV